MRPFLFFLIIIISTIILSSEKDNNKTLTQPETKLENKTINKSLNKTEKIKSGNSISNKTQAKKNKNPKKPKKKAQLSNFTNLSFNQDDNANVSNKEIFSLNDITFDMVLQKGNVFKWLVILYSETCGHCEFARRELRKIFSQYKNSTTIRFAEIEINRNPMTNMRFDIEGVPYIFLLQNNTIYEMDLYPSQKNLIEFIATDFKEVEKELKPFPPMVPIYKFGWQIIKNIFNGVTSGVNELLYDNGYEFQFTPLLLVFTIFMVFGGICIFEYLCCSRFCPDEDQKKINDRKNKKNEKKEENTKCEEEEEKEKGEIEEINDDNDENKDKNDTTEEEKIEREKEKEKEIKMKEKEEKIKKENNRENKQNKEIKDKKQKKKKKE